VRTLVDADEDAFYGKARALILDSPKRFAECVGIPEIAYLYDLTPSDPTATLAKVWKQYKSRRKKPSERWQYQLESIWAEFSEAVGNGQLAQVTQADVNAYHDRVWDEAERRGLSPTYVNHRLMSVKAIMRAALKKRDCVDESRRVLAFSDVFEFRRAAELKPTPIAHDAPASVARCCGRKMAGGAPGFLELCPSCVRASPDYSPVGIWSGRRSAFGV